MSTAFALRSSSSGPQFDGNADDVLTMQADGKCKFLPAGGGGAIVPLTLEFLVDQGRAGSTQDGSIANPFLTIQNGIDAIESSLAGAGSLLVAQGDYSSEELTCALDIAIVASTTPITVAKLGTEAGPVPALRLVNVSVTGESWLIGGFGPMVVDGGGLLGPVHMTGEPHLDGFDAQFGEVTCIDTLGVLNFRGCTVEAVLGEEGGFHAAEVNAWDSYFTGHGIDADEIRLKVCTVDGQLSGSRATLEQSTVQECHVTQLLTADTFSLFALRAGASSTQPTTVKVSDHISSLAIIAVPAIEQGSFADVDIDGSGFFAQEGDAVVVCMANSVSTPRLANVGIANAWVKADGDITVRFFGTTAGGNQLLNMALIPATP